MNSVCETISLYYSYLYYSHSAALKYKDYTPPTMRYYVYKIIPHVCSTDEFGITASELAKATSISLRSIYRILLHIRQLEVLEERPVLVKGHLASAYKINIERIREIAKKLIDFLNMVEKIIHNSSERKRIAKILMVESENSLMYEIERVRKVLEELC